VALANLRYINALNNNNNNSVARVIKCTGLGLIIKGKVFPYSLPSVGPVADPGVQAVSPQVT